MIDKNGLKKYVFDYLQNEIDWYAYSNGGFIRKIFYDDDTYTIKFITNDITYHFEITPYNEKSSNYVISVYTTDYNDFCANGCKHVFTYDEIEKFIYDCF